MKHYSGDPYWTHARFQSQCPRCHTTIRKGDRIFYYPRHKHALCESCGHPAAADFAAAAWDEDLYTQTTG